MTEWLRWTAPAAVVMSMAAPACAAQYMSVGDDHVVGKHLLIDYAVAVDADGRVRKVEILNYRESYGGEVQQAGWLQQFAGKTSTSELKVNGDIRNISGATLSSTHVTEGVKKVLAYHASHFR